MITVADAVEAPELGLRVVSGHELLEVPITLAHVSELVTPREDGPQRCVIEVTPRARTIMMTASSNATAGSAASRATAIETRSIDYVPDSERHGKVSEQGPFWFVGNFQPFTLALGFVGPAMGLSLWWTIVIAGA